MKRLLSLVLACVLTMSMIAVIPQSVSATNEEPVATEGDPITASEPEETEATVSEPEATQPEETEETQPEETEPEVTETEPEATESGVLTTSDDLIALLKFEEGFCRYPVWDYSQYTVGYGTRCPDNMLSYYRANGITDAEAELLLRNTLANTEYLINTKLIEKYDLDMTQGQFDALVSFSYNMGPGWITSPSQNIHQQVAAGATGNTIIDALSRWCKAGGKVQSFLIRRRLSESYMYIEGMYAHTPPSNYCYVLYNGNGGSTGQSVQGYNANYKGAPTGTATHSSYRFAGWYTSPTGGVKVEVLTEEYNKATLYAHWEGVSYQEPELFDEPVKVKVTTNNVNLRKGPGTNYGIIGKADKGDQYEIWQVETGGGYTWGYYKSGWICLEYTNYEEVMSGGAEEEAPTEPEATEPENTKPAPTEPEATQPEAVKPEETKKIIGIVNADPYLCVRKGPGTAYATVDTLSTGEKVEITEQKTVGSMIWGKISNGWISMSYVTVKDEAESEPAPNPGTTSGKTGTVNCSMLNVRYGAGVGYSIVGSYRKGDTVTITEEKTVGTTTWGKTAKGWVSMDYITLKETTLPEDTGSTGNTGSTEQGGTATQKYTGTVTSNDVLRIRSGAGTNYGVVGYLQPNTKVEILEQKTVGATTWGKVSKGWISMDYIKLDSTEDGGNDTLPEDEWDEDDSTVSMVKTVNVSCLLIRSGAGVDYSKVGYLYKGAKVTVTETKTVGKNVWGKIANGWICLDYTV